jgi:hypothetical protein
MKVTLSKVNFQDMEFIILRKRRKHMKVAFKTMYSQAKENLPIKMAEIIMAILTME